MYFYVKTRHPEFYTLAASKQGLFGIAKAAATGPIGPVPLALGAYYLTRPKKVAAAAPAPAPTAGGGKRTRKAAKRTRKMNRLKSRRNK
jgi:hypothetical protein